MLFNVLKFVQNLRTKIWCEKFSAEMEVLKIDPWISVCWLTGWAEDACDLCRTPPPVMSRLELRFTRGWDGAAVEE
jgi:hypothetical protein